MEKFEDWKQKQPKEADILNDWDRKHLRIGSVNVVKNMYKDFGNRFPEVILLPETSARPLHYLLSPIFKALNENSHTNIPKFIFFNPGYLPLRGERLIYTEDDRDEFNDSLDSRLERADEIKKKIQDFSMAIVDDVISRGSTIEAIREAFGKNIPAYAILSAAPQSNLDNCINLDCDHDANPANDDIAFSFTNNQKAIGVAKSPDKYPMAERDNFNEKKKLRDEMSNIGRDISKTIKYIIEQGEE